MKLTHCFNCKVYLEDTDAQGHVYHASYLKFSERARTEFFNTQGISLKDLQDQSLIFVVQKMELKFEKPSYLENILQVQTSMDSLNKASIDLTQTIYHKNDRIFHAKLRLACLSTSGRITAVPQWICSLFS